MIVEIMTAGILEFPLILVNVILIVADYESISVAWYS